MRILLTTDGEAHSQAAERLLVRLGDRATLDVITFSVTTYDIDRNDPYKSNIDRARARTRQLADEAVERLKRAGFRAAADVSEGDPGAEIVTKVESEGFDMAIVGGSRHSFLRQRLLGTTSSFVLHNSPSSVMIVHQAAEAEGPVKVLVATDGSEHAENAARTFAEFVDPTRCEATVAGVANREPTEAQEHVDRLVTLLEKEGISAQGEVHRGSPAGTLLSLADERGYDLVVLGSLGRGPLRRALLGSVSDHVAHHAPAALVDRRR